MIRSIKKHKSILLTSLFFGLLYALISLVNHYFFKTYALDLGLYTNAMYKYAHFQMADSAMIKDFAEPLLGGHFDLYLMLFSPFIFVFGTYTLLIIQILAVMLGGIGIYKFFQLKESGNQFIPIIAALYFYTFYGIFGAFSFDYHSVVVASCVVPWFFIALQKEQKGISLGLLFFMLIAQENVALWLIFVCIGLAIEYRKNREIARHLILLSGISLLYFIVVVFFVIPLFSVSQEYTGFLYSTLGNTPWEAIKTVFLHPIDSFSKLFVNHNNHIYGDYIKLELHLILVFAGLPLLIKKPHFLLMLLPIYFQKLLHDNYTLWGIGGHYNIEFAPIMAIGIFLVIASFRNKRFVKYISVFVLIFSVASTIRTMDNTVHFTDKSRIRFYQKQHYETDYDVKKVQQQLLEIPENAKVSAQSPFVPHLSLRQNIYQFPKIQDADYIVFSNKEGPYPLTEETFELTIKELKKANEWKVMSMEEITILKRVKL